MDRVGPSCSWQQCAAPPTTPRIKLFHGLTCAKKTRPRRATAPDSPGYTASPQGAPQLFRDSVQLCSGLVDLVVGVGHHSGGGHRFTLAGQRFVGLAAEHIAQACDRGAKL